VYNALADVLNQRRDQTHVGDEGGFAPSLGDNKPALDVIFEAIEKAGYGAGEGVGDRARPRGKRRDPDVDRGDDIGLRPGKAAGGAG